MNAEILCVGTELLLGDIVNTNAAHIAKGLAECGVGCYYQTVVGDNPDRLKHCLEQAMARADMVIMTGGLGPTFDDLTKETVADYFGLEMQMHEPSLQRLRAFFERLGRDMTPNNEKQAMMPKGAVVFENAQGTAPGLAVEGNGKTAILMPGPPREMTMMFDSQVKPYLLGRSDKTLVSHNINLFGVGESNVEYELREYMESCSNPTIAPYAKEGEMLLRVTASAATAKEADTLTHPVIEDIRQRYEKNIYGIDAGTLENALVSLLAEKGLTIAVAESCTGGLVAKRITDIPGASRVFQCGVCTYSNEMKTRLIGVSPDTLEAHGAVSAETAAEMARGVRTLAGADIGLAITGVAGPDGGTDEKPVGLTFIGVSTASGETVKERQLSRGYGSERAFIRNIAASNALWQALKAARK